MQPIGVEIAGSNSSQYFIFIQPRGDYSIRVSRSGPQFTQGWFLPCNLIAVTAICFKQQKVWATLADL